MRITSGPDTTKMGIHLSGPPGVDRNRAWLPKLGVIATNGDKQSTWPTS
jgi:hypothetical protein